VQIDTRRQYINRELKGLIDAGWIEKVNRGLYRFVEDPR
jgi:predicted transcriptional regulator